MKGSSTSSFGNGCKEGDEVNAEELRQLAFRSKTVKTVRIEVMAVL